MAWKTEKLIGTVDGVNKTFTISFTPVAGSIKVFFTGIRLEGVGTQPDLMQWAFAQSGTTIVLGLAPNVGQYAWATYWY